MRFYRIWGLIEEDMKENEFVLRNNRYKSMTINKKAQLFSIDQQRKAYLFVESICDGMVNMGAIINDCKDVYGTGG